MRNPRILVVEDEGIIATDLSNRLEDLGYSVAGVASTKEEAIERAARTLPDLALMDIMLKGDMGGIDAAQEIRLRLDIPVVYLTGYSDEATLRRAVKTEPFGYVLKPFEDKDLRTAIEIALYKHAAERSLKESREWFATTLRCVTDAVIATDGLLRVKFLSALAETLTGTTLEEAQGKEVARVLPIVDARGEPVAEALVRAAMRDGHVTRSGNETVLVAADGSRRHVEVSAAPIRYDQGNVAGVVVAFRDITVRRRMEEEVLRVQKLESIGLLAGGVAHDFNNVLTVILGCLSLAKLGMQSSSDAYSLLAEAEKAAQRAAELSRQFLTFARGGAPMRRVAPMGEVVRGAASLVMHGSTIKLELSVPDDVWPAEVDTDQIGQVVNHLVTNAIQASPAGGTVWVRCENARVGGPGPNGAESTVLAPGNYVKIAVLDRGLGILPEDLKKIFAPYFTTKQRLGAIGLGLTTAYSIVRRHGGHIAVESTPGAGSTFTVFVPAREGGKPSGAPRPEAAAALAPGRGRVLVMDDEPLVRTMAGKMLERLGYEVDFAPEGGRAVETFLKARSTGRPFDAVIMDLTVPGGMGGREAAALLLESAPDARIVVSSGYSSDPILATFREHGFRACLAKPYRIESLSQVLKQVLGAA